jgi:uncharacterized membrane protein
MIKWDYRVLLLRMLIGFLSAAGVTGLAALFGKFGVGEAADIAKSVIDHVITIVIVIASAVFGVDTKVFGDFKNAASGGD